MACKKAQEPAPSPKPKPKPGPKPNSGRGRKRSQPEIAAQSQLDFSAAKTPLFPAPEPPLKSPKVKGEPLAVEVKDEKGTSSATVKVKKEHYQFNSFQTPNSKNSFVRLRLRSNLYLYI